MISNSAYGFLGLLLSVAALWAILATARRMAPKGTSNAQIQHQRVLVAAGATAGVVALLSAIDIFAHKPPHEARANLIGLALVAAFSGLVGFSEIAQRYRDRPFKLLTATPALIYIYINMAGGLGAYALVDEFQVFNRKQPHAVVYSIMLASFGAVAFFRSSFFTARVGTTDIDVGPATLMKGLLSVTDDMVNRWQAADRAADVASIMRMVDFEKARYALPALCFTSVQFVSEQQQKACGNAVQELETLVMEPLQRSIILGIYLTQIVGPEVLRSAVEALKDTLEPDPPPVPATRQAPDTTAQA